MLASELAHHEHVNNQTDSTFDTNKCFFTCIIYHLYSKCSEVCQIYSPPMLCLSEEKSSTLQNESHSLSSLKQFCVFCRNTFPLIVLAAQNMCSWALLKKTTEQHDSQQQCCQKHPNKWEKEARHLLTIFTTALIKSGQVLNVLQFFLERSRKTS